MKSPLMVSLLLLTTLLAQDTARHKEDMTGSVEGVVVEASTSRAVQRASVFARGTANAEATSDAKGHYVIKDLPSGSYEIIVEKSGYGMTGANSRHLTLAAGSRLEGVDFRLPEEAIIAGRVLDADRNPVAGVQVWVARKDFSDGRSTLVYAGSSAFTDDLGRYRIANLSGGRYYIIAHAKSLAIRKPRGHFAGRSPNSVSPGMVRNVFYPNGRTSAEGSWVYLPAGGQAGGMDLTLQNAQTFCARGRFAGESAANAPLVIGLRISEPIGDSRLVVCSGTLPVGNEFEVCGLPAALYLLESSGQNPATSPADAKVAGAALSSFTIADQDVDLGTLSLAAGSQMPGRVTVVDTAPDEPVPTGIVVALTLRGRSNYPGETLRARVDSAGRFVMPNVFVGDYGLKIEGLPKGYYVKEATQSGGDALNNPIRPEWGELRIGLRADGSSVAGQVLDHDGQPVRDATVILAPGSTSAPNHPVSRQADQDGYFAVRSGLAPGEYSILAFADLFEGEGLDPDFLRAHATEATRFELAAREDKVLRVVVRNAHEAH
jgi:hypothetical protein